MRSDHRRSGININPCAGQIVLDRSFRAQCASNACGVYGKCWMCPPDVGEIEPLMAEIRKYKQTLWYQSIAQLEDSFDVEGMFDADHVPAHPVVVPGCTYCHPQVASVGKRERELKEAGVEYKVGKFPFQAIGRAVAGGDTEGFVKLLFGKENGELLGAHIMGDTATEMITQPELAMNSELTEEDMKAMIYAHPTLSEAIHEAVLAADGRAIHA